jgi:hypothetical protein
MASEPAFGPRNDLRVIRQTHANSFSGLNGHGKWLKTRRDLTHSTAGVTLFAAAEVCPPFSGLV